MQSVSARGTASFLHSLHPAIAFRWGAGPNLASGCMGWDRHLHIFARKTKELAMSDSAAKVEAIIAELAAAFPAAFALDLKMVRPLKLRIKDDLYGQSAISHRRITAALRAYCNSEHYLKATEEGAVRIDLEGRLAGTVTPKEAHHTREALAALAKGTKGPSGIAKRLQDARLRGLRAARPPEPFDPGAQSETSKPTLTTETPRQKGLSLSDLKRAAAVRKARG
jgi:sRNA-binding protein